VKSTAPNPAPWRKIEVEPVPALLDLYMKRVSKEMRATDDEKNDNHR
jgi:hypothetical protein